MAVPVLREELLLVTYPTHPLAKKKTVAPADLDRPAVRAVRDRVDHAPHGRRASSPASGSSPTIVMETENVEIIKAMVRNGLGISIIPWQAAAADVTSRQLFCSRISGVRWSGRQAGSIRR